jgi:hypothetical protein
MAVALQSLRADMLCQEMSLRAAKKFGGEESQSQKNKRGSKYNGKSRAYVYVQKGKAVPVVK